MTQRDPHAGLPVLSAGVSLPDARCVLISLHGRGATPTHALQLARDIAPPGSAVLAPQASGNSWYPHSFLAPIASNEPWLSSALCCIARVVDQARQCGFTRERVHLLGFSQGACLACEFIARDPGDVGSCVALTGGLIGEQIDADAYADSLQGLRVQLTTGDSDPHVPLHRVEATAALMESRGAHVVQRVYAGRPHTVSAKEIIEARSHVLGS